MNTTSSASPARAKAEYTRAKPSLKGSATWSVNTSGAAPVPPSPPSMVTKSGAAAASRPSASASSSRSRLAHRRLDADRQAGRRRPARSTKSSSPSTSSNAGVRGGLMQSRPGATRGWPRSRGHLGRRQKAAEPGLAPWQSLISMRAHRRCSASVSWRCGEAEPPALVPAAEVAGADLEHELAALRGGTASPPSPVFCRQPARAAPLFIASTAAPEGAEAHARDVHHRGRPEGAPPPVRAAQHLCAGRRVVGVAARAPSGGGATGNGACLMIRHVLTDSMSLSVPKPNVLGSPLGGGVDPAALVAAEGPLLVVAR